MDETKYNCTFEANYRAQTCVQKYQDFMVPERIIITATMVENREVAI
jgi:hypothetical protein